jgi:FixJ family two-component response regulator
MQTVLLRNCSIPQKPSCAREPNSNTICVILDIHLAGMSGFDLGRLLTERGYRFSIIFITAVDDDATRKQAQDVGCLAYLRKPFPGNRLINAIKRATLGDA